MDLPALQKTDDIDFAAADLVFCALPHGTSQAVVQALPKR
jgi:N-acetyl-gamma-glutamyl-phosphate reductase